MNLNGFMIYLDCDDVLVPTRHSIQREIDKATNMFPMSELIQADHLITEGIDLLNSINTVKSIYALKLFNSLVRIIKKSVFPFKEMEKQFEFIRKFQFGYNYNGKTYDYPNYQNDENYYIALDLIKEGLLRRERYLEERDHFMETDNPKIDGHIDYDSMYTLDKLNPYALQFIADLKKSGCGLSVISHHNGGRELDSKNRLIINDLNCDFIPLRFHKMEYVDGYRRPRNSKAEYLLNNGVKDLSKSILIDDSIDNINSWVENGGIGILYDENNRYEDNNRYYVIHELTIEEVERCISKHIDKQKILI